VRDGSTYPVYYSLEKDGANSCATMAMKIGNGAVFE